ncbi:hypothetical protein CW718_12105 [Macrococcoides caseolyticum]|nr:hypothetical protein CW718_12105 [Macrococcus caseolyticus]
MKSVLEMIKQRNSLLDSTTSTGPKARSATLSRWAASGEPDASLGPTWKRRQAGLELKGNPVDAAFQFPQASLPCCRDHGGEAGGGAGGPAGTCRSTEDRDTMIC